MTPLDLHPTQQIRIPAMAMAVIAHDLTIPPDHPQLGRLWIVRHPQAWAEWNLMVDQGPIGPGPVVTRVLNLSQKPISIRTGTVISLLVAVTLETPDVT